MKEELYKCHPARKEHMKILGLPTERPENWKEIAIQKMGQLVKKYRSLPLYLDICARCGACLDKCPFYLGTEDPKNMPAARAEMLRKVYRRYFTLSGKLFGKLVGAEDLTEEVLEEWYSYFYQCSECRRCSVFCPFGIDTAEITMAAREIMASIGVATKYVTEVVVKVYELGNNLGIPPPAWKASCEFLEGEIKEDFGADVKIPVDKEGADILFVPPSGDLFANPETFMGCAMVLDYVGANWTTSTYAGEAGNFGLFLNYHHMKKANKRIVDAARQLGVKKVILGECGHAWRVAYDFMDTMNGPLDFLDPPRPQHIIEYTADLIRKGELELDPSRNDNYVVTYHDSCNPARAADKALIEEPRYILKHVVNNFIEMPPDTIREKTFCCGAGGGLLTDEIIDIRMKGVKPRIDVLKPLIETKGVNYLAMICAICKANFDEALRHYELDITKGGVHDLVARALVWK